MEWNDFLQNIPVLLHGIFITLSLVSLSLMVGFSLSILFTIGSLSRKTWLSMPIKMFIFVIRGTPLLVQFFIIYYGAGQFQALQNSLLWSFFKQPFACAMLTLALNTSAYSTEIFLGAIRFIPKGEIDACHAFGMPWGLKLRRVIFPRALRTAIPAYSNEVIMLVKSSSLASTITLLDLMGITQQLINKTYLVIEFYMLAGMVYLLINSALMLLFKMIETRANQYLLK